MAAPRFLRSLDALGGAILRHLPVIGRLRRLERQLADARRVQRELADGQAALARGLQGIEDELARLGDRLRDEARRIDPATGQPNGSYLNERFRDYEWAILNVKALGIELARRRVAALPAQDVAAPPIVGLASKLCTQADMESPWAAYWLREMGFAVLYHRKHWEFAYVAQALSEAGVLRPGSRGLGFGCGEEPLPSLFAKHGARVLVTDQEPAAAHDQGWSATGQHADSLARVRQAAICPDPERLAGIDLRYVDMNAVPADLDGQFDFCWSCCALEHLGSIAQGLAFIEASVRTLRPGGVAVHTLEFNLADDGETIDNWPTVLFQQRHMAALRDRLAAQGHRVAPLDFDVGTGVMDQLVDFPPWHPAMPKFTEQLAHLRLSVDGFACTSFGLIVRAAG